MELLGSASPQVMKAGRARCVKSTPPYATPTPEHTRAGSPFILPSCFSSFARLPPLPDNTPRKLLRLRENNPARDRNVSYTPHPEKLSMALRHCCVSAFVRSGKSGLPDEVDGNDDVAGPLLDAA